MNSLLIIGLLVGGLVLETILYMGALYALGLNRGAIRAHADTVQYLRALLKEKEGQYKDDIRRLQAESSEETVKGTIKAFLKEAST